VQSGWQGLDAEAYRTLFFRYGDGVIFTDPATGDILAANPAACDLLGYREEELCRVGRDGIRDPADSARWDAALAERDQSGSVNRELSFLRADGSSFVAEVTWTMFRDGAGRSRACATFRDVTVRRAGEAALRRSEQVLRRLIATSNDAFIAADTEGRIQEWNNQAEVIFGMGQR
jgi:hypothetical protein